MSSAILNLDLFVPACIGARDLVGYGMAPLAGEIPMPMAPGAPAPSILPAARALPPCYSSARRATRIDPKTALHKE
jgi:hypothetical protein